MLFCCQILCQTTGDAVSARALGEPPPEGHLYEKIRTPLKSTLDTQNQLTIEMLWETHSFFFILLIFIYIFILYHSIFIAFIIFIAFFSIILYLHQHNVHWTRASHQRFLRCWAWGRSQKARSSSPHRPRACPWRPPRFLQIWEEHWKLNKIDKYIDKYIENYYGILWNIMDYYGLLWIIMDYWYVLICIVYIYVL